MYDEFKQVWDNLTSPGQQFELTEVTVRGQTIKAYANAPPSLKEVWLASAVFSERDYLVYQDERWTYAEAHQDVASLANWLQEKGIKQGDRVAIAMRNYPEWLLSYWACVSQGIGAVGMNAWWIDEEMDYALKDSAPKVLICDQERLDRFKKIQGSFPGMVIVGVRLDAPVEGVVPWADVMTTGGDLPERNIDGDDDACIFYTSGTTGLPKGAQLTHRGCVNNLMNLAFAGGLFGAANAISAGEPVPNPEDAPVGSGLVTTPLFHVTANNCLSHGLTLTGGKLVHMYKWDAGEALKLIEREGITSLTGVPVMSRELISHPDFDKYDTSTLLSVGGGGAQL